ncbi:arylsulfatase [Aspergillus lentulus]|nr:arylsulfatase [Aspergillus lentulus]
MTSRPNFLIIVADDLGFSDCGCFGSEISTPNIDALAYSPGGLRFTSFHVAAACAPTRSMLMTGTDHHLTGLGQMPEYIALSRAHQGAPGHEGYLNERVVALPELLRDGGYYTLMSGKWHLGLKWEYSPHARGFAKSYAMLSGAANHYGYEPEYDDIVAGVHPFFQTTVTALHMEDAEYSTKLPEDFYSSKTYASKVIEFLSERPESEKGKPFFAYLPFTAPHWPLQAPKPYVDKYRGKYDNGPAALRLKRLERLKELGLVAPDIVPHEVVTGPGGLDWETMNDEERAKSARAMEVYAAMVQVMDDNIGRVVDYLRQSGEYDDTIICFMSDNGAEGASYEASPLGGSGITAHLEKYYDNSLENIGRPTSYVWYGSHWAQAATAPSRLYKMFSTEGGCRVPLVVKPAGDPEALHEGGRIIDAFCTVMDIVPTILEYAGLQHPGTTYRGRKIERVRGVSWKPFLDAIAVAGIDTSPALSSIHGEDHVTGWEIAGSGALRKGRYKITYVPLPRGPQRWELFDIVEDPGETHDLSKEKPGIFSELLRLWAVYAEEVGVVGLAGQIPANNQVVKEVKDEYEDTGRWMRFIGKDNVPPEIQARLPR